jgi:hypothetical protein
MDWWTWVAFGWPAAVLSGGLFALAFLTPHSWAGFVGAAIAAPFCWYASSYPLFYWPALIAMGANVLAAVLLQRGRPDFAFAALVPLMMVVATFAVFAFRDIHLIRE